MVGTLSVGVGNPFYSYFTGVGLLAQGTPKWGDRETLYFIYQEL